MKPRILTGDDIALAMELRTEGCSWENIAEGFGVTRKTLRVNVEHYQNAGYRKAPEGVCKRIRTDYVQERAREILEGNPEGVAPYREDSRRWMEAS